MDEHLTQPDSPSFSPDGKYLYYHVSYSIAEGLGMLTAGHRILRREAATGRFENVRLSGPAEPTPDFRAALNSGGDRKSTRLNSSHPRLSRMPSSA